MKKIITIIIVIILTIVLGIYLRSNFTQPDNPNTNACNYSSSDSSQTGCNQNNQSEMRTDRIEVVHFHATQQCWSCTTVGKYALKTIQEKFPEEYKSGKIVFKDINAELPENQAIVVLYQARGSSLFVNSIQNGQDNIEEDTTVWRLVSNEEQYISYLENRLNQLLNN